MGSLSKISHHEPQPKDDSKRRSCGCNPTAIQPDMFSNDPPLVYRFEEVQSHIEQLGQQISKLYASDHQVNKRRTSTDSNLMKARKALALEETLQQTIVAFIKLQETSEKEMTRLKAENQIKQIAPSLALQGNSRSNDSRELSQNDKVLGLKIIPWAPRSTSPSATKAKQKNSHPKIHGKVPCVNCHVMRWSEFCDDDIGSTQAGKAEEDQARQCVNCFCSGIICERFRCVKGSSCGNVQCQFSHEGDIHYKPAKVSTNKSNRRQRIEMHAVVKSPAETAGYRRYWPE